MASERGYVFAIATPVRVESVAGKTLRELWGEYGVPDNLSEEARAAVDEPMLGEVTVFDIHQSVIPDTLEEIGAYRPGGLKVSSLEDIKLGRKGLYLFYPGLSGWRDEPYYELSVCNGGYTVERVLHFAATGVDTHWTAREVCGHSVYKWSRGPVYGLDPDTMTAWCRADYDRITQRGLAGERRKFPYGQPLPD